MLDRSALHRLRRVLGLALCGLVTVVAADAHAFSVTSTATSSSCPSVSPGYSNDARFTVTVANTDCTGTYTVVVTASPSGGTPSPSTYIGRPAGTFTFQPVVPGTYQVTITDTSACGAAPQSIEVTVLPSTDTIAPIFYVTEVLRNILADSDSSSPTTNTAPLGPLAIPEGTCGYQMTYYAYGFDNCDGFVVAVDALAASTSGSAMDPGTLATTTPDGFGYYSIDVFWSIGTSSTLLTFKDASGNEAVVTLTMELTGDVANCVAPTGEDPDTNVCSDPGAAPAVCAAGGTTFAIGVNGPAGPKYVVCSVAPAGYDGNTVDELRCEGAGNGGIPTLFDPSAIVAQFGDGFCGIP